MRWPFRRKGAQAAPGSAAPRDGSPGAPAIRRPVREWATLPPIRVASARPAPLVIGPAPVLPPLPGPRLVPGPPVPPATGWVDGISTVLPPRPQPSHVDTAPAAVPPVPVLHRTGRPLPAEVPALTEAADEYVGEPREPAVPYRAPGWLRHAPPWLEQGGPGLDPLAALGVPVSPSPGFPQMITPPTFIPSTVESEAPPPLPPPVQEVAGRTAPEPPPTVLKRRRANLADSRRLGLGAPVSRPASEPFTLPSQELVLPPAVAPEIPEPVDEPEPPSVVEEPGPVVVVEEPPPSPPPAPEPPPPTPAVASPPPPVGAESPPRVVRPKYRATHATRPAKATRQVQRAVVVERVPPELIDAVRATQRADVSDVPVFRGSRVSEAARARGARAFAAGGAVFLPDEAGPADSPGTRGLLAHELVHAVQQRTLGPVLPALSSPEGQALEAEAQAAERWYSGEAGAPPPAPLIHAPAPGATRGGQDEPTVSVVDSVGPAQHAPLAPSPPATQAQPSSLHTPFDEPTRQAVGQIAETSAKKVVEEWTNPALGGQGFSGGKGSGGKSAAGSGGSGSGSAASGGRGAGSKGPSGAHAAAAVTAATAGAAFNEAARRQQLIDDRLKQINDERTERGEVDLTSLPDDELARIEQMVAEEAARHGGATAGAQTPQRKLSTGERWLAGLTGTTEHDGNMSLSGLWTKPGEEGSWFESKVDEANRTPENVMADIGLASHDKSSFDYHDWLEGSGDKSPMSDADAGAHGPSHMQSQAESKAHGRPSHEDKPLDLGKLDLDELTARLYDRLRSRMRLELLVDRERAGRLTDFR